MAFAGSNLKLSDVTTAYGASSLLGMRGKTSYASSTDPTTAVTVGNTALVNLSSFFNRFISSTGTLANKDNGNQDVIYYGYGTESLTNMSYVMTNGVLTRITLNWNLGSGNRNGGQGTTTNSQVLEIRSNTQVITTSNSANTTLTFNVSVPAGNTFTIYIFANVNNPPAGQQNGMSLTANYSVNANGLLSV
jgi:hypothetical protein